MANNKITTKSYFIKRLRDGGYVVDKVNVVFSEDDSRRWVVLVDNGISSVFVFCHTDASFSFYDGQRFFNAPNVHLKTDSIEVIVEVLNAKGIVNKHSSYCNFTPVPEFEDLVDEALVET